MVVWRGFKGKDRARAHASIARSSDIPLDARFVPLLLCADKSYQNYFFLHEWQTHTVFTPRMRLFHLKNQHVQRLKVNVS